MKHKNCEMIMAKAVNMDLVVFCKDKSEGAWVETHFENMLHNETFLCLPQHGDFCLHWLNGGELQLMEHKCKVNDATWEDFTIVPELQPWYSSILFMSSCHSFKIKPKKEKRWIGVFIDKLTLSGKAIMRTTELSYESIEELKRDSHAPDGFGGWQFIEIEVEV